VLLSDTRVVRFVNENFVPCWQSVRPVPQVTIDFGNGRKLHRTLAGNTVIEICLPDGRVVDSFPGIYLPEDLLGEARESLELVRQLNPAMSEAAVASTVIAWHRARALAPPLIPVPISINKSAVQSPLLRALRLDPKQPSTTDLLARELGRNPVAMSEPTDPKAALARISRQLEDISEQPSTVEQLRQRFLLLPEGARPSPAELGQMALRVDSRTNVNRVRPAVHLLFATYDRLPRGTECREAVFKQLLHVPVDDPYLGLTGALVPGTPNGSEPGR
jgi:hypothetical protein